MVFENTSVGGLGGGMRFEVGLGDGRLLIVVSVFYIDYVTTAFSSNMAATPLRSTTKVLVIPFRGDVGQVDSILGKVRSHVHSGRRVLDRGRGLGTRVSDLARRGGGLVRSRARCMELRRVCGLSRRCARCPGVTTRVVSGSPNG